MKIKAMKLYRVKVPNRERSLKGQGSGNPFFIFRKGDSELKLPFGVLVEAREKCNYPFEVSQSEKKHLVHIDFIKEHQNLFKPL